MLSILEYPFVLAWSRRRIPEYKADTRSAILVELTKFIVARNKRRQSCHVHGLARRSTFVQAWFLVSKSSMHEGQSTRASKRVDFLHSQSTAADVANFRAATQNGLLFYLFFEDLKDITVLSSYVPIDWVPYSSRLSSSDP